MYKFFACAMDILYLDLINSNINNKYKIFLICLLIEFIIYDTLNLFIDNFYGKIISILIFRISFIFINNITEFENYSKIYKFILVIVILIISGLLDKQTQLL